MTDWKIVYAQLQAFEDKREVLKAMRQAIRKPVPAVTDAIRARAMTILPQRGGLGAWVAELAVKSTVSVTGRAVALKLKGGRDSLRGRSDLNAINRGRVRAPTWGHRKPSHWHLQMVPSGFFSDAARDSADLVENAITEAVDDAFDQIRRG